MLTPKIYRRPKDIILFSLFAVLLFIGHRTGFITILALFCMLVPFVVPITRYIDSLGVLLITFTICFIFIGVINGCVDSLSTAIAYYIPTIFFYCLGKYIIDKIDFKYQICSILIIIIALYSLELYTSIVGSILSTGSILNTSRLFYFGGDESRQLTATLVGLGASLGFIGLPMFIIYKDSKLVRLSFLILFLFSLIITIHLINRTGLVVCILSLLVTLIYYYRSNTAQLLFIIILSVIVYYILLKLGAINQEILDAYASRNEVDLVSGGGRFQKWVYALKQLFVSPFGWAENAGKTVDYVHNMWLDIAKVVGIIPFITLVCCTISSFKVLLKLMKAQKDIVVAMLLSLNVCFFISCFVEPVYGGLHFFLYVMLWGIQKQYLVRYYRS